MLAVRRRVLHWYRNNERKLPWRATKNPYVILVSEIMLQQTQVSRVQEKHPRFIKTFPTVEHLARSSKPDVIRAWQGLGYNNRAVRLWELAREVTDRHNGRIPSNVQELKKLAGVGEYTANAVACFAFGQRVPVVDVNIRRVLSRIFRRNSRLNNSDVSSIAAQVLPRDAYTWNQSLMDLGATICIQRNPRCAECPVESLCLSRSIFRSTGNREHPRRSQRTTEPMYDRIPRRIWRGRIVEALRNLNGARSTTLPRLGKIIKQNFTETEVRWLHSLIRQLENDRLVKTTVGNGTLRIMLASQ